MTHFVVHNVIRDTILWPLSFTMLFIRPLLLHEQSWYRIAVLVIIGATVRFEKHSDGFYLNRNQFFIWAAGSSITNRHFRPHVKNYYITNCSFARNLKLLVVSGTQCITSHISLSVRCKYQRFFSYFRRIISWLRQATYLFYLLIRKENI